MFVTGRLRLKPPRCPHCGLTTKLEPSTYRLFIFEWHCKCGAKFHHETGKEVEKMPQYITYADGKRLPPKRLIRDH